MSRMDLAVLGTNVGMGDENRTGNPTTSNLSTLSRQQLHLELDDFSELFGIGVGLSVDCQPPSIPPLPPLQETPTVTPGQISLPNDRQDIFSRRGPYRLQSMGSDDLLELQYLPESLSKPFGSLSDFQALALEEDYPFPGRDVVEGSVSDMEVSLAQYGHVPPISDNHPSITSLGAYRSSNRIGCITTDPSLAASGDHLTRGMSSSSYLPSSVEFLPSSLPPTMLHYDTQGRFLAGTSGDGSGFVEGNTTNEGISLVLSGLSNLSDPNGGHSSLPGIRKGPDHSTGIEPTTVMRRTGRATLPSGLGQGSRRGSRRPTVTLATYSNVPTSLPIPTRSKPTSLKGWKEYNQGHISPSYINNPNATAGTFTTASDVQGEGKKRKREFESDSGGDGNEEIRRSSSLRRELLGLRTIRMGNSTRGEEGCRVERKGKRRRIESSSVTSRKGKEKEKAECDLIDEYSDDDDEDQDDDEGDDDDDDDDDDADVYYPSRSPSPAIDHTTSRFGSLSSSGTGSSHRRSASAQTTGTTTTSMSFDCDEEEGKDRKRGKGKTKGSAALALAKITMLSGKPPTSPWGTYVPFSLDDGQRVPNIVPGDDVRVRAGRRRRNGHIPLPVPIPHLIKKSRGRKVPHAEKDVASQGSSSSGKRNVDELKRVFVCEVSGCGKCFVRGEHLKRHVRSIHTHDKPHPCPYEGCDKSFSRRDNLGQHVRIHLPNNR